MKYSIKQFVRANSQKIYHIEMKKYMKQLFVLCCLLPLLSGCFDFEEINDNPNNIKDVDPGGLLGAAIYDGVHRNLYNSHRFGMYLGQQVTNTSLINEIHRYVISPAESNRIYDYLYRILNDVEDIINNSKENNYPNYEAAGYVLKAWMFSILTDTFGDVPYSEALKGKDKDFMPKFDTQEAIYTDLLKNLDYASTLFDEANGFQFGGDYLYNGDVVKWQKFCNSLRIKLLMRCSKRSEINAPERIALIYQNEPLFSSYEDGAVLHYTGDGAFRNPFTTSNSDNFEARLAASTTFIDVMNYNLDPRRYAYFTDVSGEFNGLPSGVDPEEVSSHPRLARLRPEFRDPQCKGSILTHAELEFFLAEAALKGWISASAETHYEAGIRSSMKYWGVTDSDTEQFLLREKVIFDGTLYQIFEQKWIDSYFNGMETWIEYRRNRMPEFNFTGHMGNGGQTPTRFIYPTYLQSLNADNYEEAVERIGGDNMQTVCWWEK